MGVPDGSGVLWVFLRDQVVQVSFGCSQGFWCALAVPDRSGGFRCGLAVNGPGGSGVVWLFLRVQVCSGVLWLFLKAQVVQMCFGCS